MTMSDLAPPNSNTYPSGGYQVDTCGPTRPDRLRRRSQPTRLLVLPGYPQSYPVGPQVQIPRG